MKFFKSIFVMCLMAILTTQTFAQTEIIGEWIVGEKNTVIKIIEKDGVCSGNIISSDNPKAEIGKELIKELKLSEDMWEGKVYSPKREEWYDTEVTRDGEKLLIKVSVGFFSKTIEWIKK